MRITRVIAFHCALRRSGYLAIHRLTVSILCPRNPVPPKGVRAANGLGFAGASKAPGQPRNVSGKPPFRRPEKTREARYSTFHRRNVRPQVHQYGETPRVFRPGKLGTSESPEDYRVNRSPRATGPPDPPEGGPRIFWRRPAQLNPYPTAEGVVKSRDESPHSRSRSPRATGGST